MGKTGNYSVEGRDAAGGLSNDCPYLQSALETQEADDSE
jgi:hypothetical protein